MNKMNKAEMSVFGDQTGEERGSRKTKMDENVNSLKEMASKKM